MCIAPLQGSLSQQQISNDALRAQSGWGPAGPPVYPPLANLARPGNNPPSPLPAPFATSWWNLGGPSGLCGRRSLHDCTPGLSNDGGSSAFDQGPHRRRRRPRRRRAYYWHGVGYPPPGLGGRGLEQHVSLRPSERNEPDCLFRGRLPLCRAAARDLDGKGCGVVRGDESGRLVYLSAQEGTEEAPVAAPKKAAKPKRVTTAQLAEQMAQVSEVLPQLVAQVRALAEKQEILDKGPKPLTAPAHQQPFPKLGNAPEHERASLLLGAAVPPSGRLGAAMKTASSAAGVNPVPKAQGPQVIAQADAQGASFASGDCSGQLATAIAQQGQALAMLVGHLAAQEDAIDLTGTASTITSKGSSKREKMQTDLALRQSSYFLQVCQNAYRRLFPSSPVPQTLEAS